MPFSQLIFLAGPQADLRVNIESNNILVGRSVQCDVRLEEPYASRQHFSITRSPDGYIFENTSGKPCKINGKKFKADQQIILDTGDIIDIPAETKILFVSAGDNVEDAIFKAGGIQAGIEEQFEEPIQEVFQSQPEPKVAPKDAIKQKPAKITDATQAKFKKYLIIFGIYLLVVAVGALLLHMKLKGTDSGTGQDKDQPKRLTNEQIENILTEDFERTRNTRETRVQLNEARKWYESKLDPSHLYHTVYHYRLARAYSKNDLPADTERLYRQARRDLIEQIQEKYQNAWTLEKARQFRQAERQYNVLIVMAPRIKDYDDPILSKILEHLAYIKKEQKKHKGKKR